MKKYLRLFPAVAFLFSVGCFAQGGDRVSPISNIESDLLIASYHVEERINMNFGSRVTTYNVPSLNMISRRDLGPNNSRTITPKFGKAKLVALSIEVKSLETGQTKSSIVISAFSVEIRKPKAAIAAETVKIVNIDILATYERIIDKGYQSVDMLKRVGNNRFFGGDLQMAAKWYSQLFALTSDLEAAYYYRYAQSLKSINQIEKSNEMMAIFESKSR